MKTYRSIVVSEIFVCALCFDCRNFFIVHRKLTMSLLLQVFWDNTASVVKNAVLPSCSSLSTQTYNSLTDVQKFITLRPFIGSGSVSTHWPIGKMRNFSTYVLSKPKSDSGHNGSKTGNLD
jgi:hypothetical protein